MDVREVANYLLNHCFLPSQAEDLLEKHYYANGRTRHRPTVFREGQNGDYYAILRYAANVNMLATISEYAFIDHAEDVCAFCLTKGCAPRRRPFTTAFWSIFGRTNTN